MVDKGGMPEDKQLGTREQGSRTHDAKCRSVRKGDDIAERLLWLGAQVLKQMPNLEKTPGAKNVARQLERCATAGGANYEEARGAESPGDFVHKVRVALKELRETGYWLKRLMRADLVDDVDCFQRMIHETGELIAILTASANTARRRARTGDR